MTNLVTVKSEASLNHFYAEHEGVTELYKSHIYLKAGAVSFAEFNML
jgi:hypothetical protein